MAKVIPINERFQHFVEELQESFWGDLYGRISVGGRRWQTNSIGRCCFGFAAESGRNLSPETIGRTISPCDFAITARSAQNLPVAECR